MSEEKSVRLVSGGDVEFAIRPKDLPSVSAPEVQAALDYLKQGDLCFMNCEMGLSCGGYRIPKVFNIRSDPSFVEDLVSMGIQGVSLANNHVMDFGHEALFETLATIDAAGIPRTGAGHNLEESLRPCYLEAKGQRFAFIGVATTLPPASAADVDRPGIAPIHVITSYEADPGWLAEGPGGAPIVHTQANQQDVDRVCTAIVAAKRKADHVIIAPHWGVNKNRVAPQQSQVAEYQPPLGKAFIDAGADIVLGMHTHNLLGIEVYKGKPIFYSLGNFIFQPLHTTIMEPESVIVLADFAGESMRMSLVPILSNVDGFASLPSPAGREQVYKRLQEQSRPFGTQFSMGGDGIIKLRLGVE